MLFSKFGSSADSVEARTIRNQSNFWWISLHVYDNSKTYSKYFLIEVCNDKYIGNDFWSEYFTNQGNIEPLKEIDWKVRTTIERKTKHRPN